MEVQVRSKASARPLRLCGLGSIGGHRGDAESDEGCEKDIENRAT
jgi:hypothetical protein